MSDQKTSIFISLLVALAAFVLYLVTLAPGFTWAHFGADGGDLLAAAVTGGVPHPSGYPLYTLLLQFWLNFIGLLAPAQEIAWRGNLLSAVMATASVAVTGEVARELMGARNAGWVSERWALFITALAWSVAPLLWGQAQITEVYTLHALLFSLIAWLTLGRRIPSPRWRWPLLGFVLGLSLAHHLTIILVLPAILYWLWTEKRGDLSAPTLLLTATLFLSPLLLYLRIPLAGTRSPTAPVFWGFPGDWEGLTWLVSASAYRRYLALPSPEMLLAQASESAAVLLTQWTILGFALALAGLFYLDEKRPHLRNFSLLWLFPSLLYTLSYNTIDSRVYLMPVVWVSALWLPYGVELWSDWLQAKSRLSRVARHAPVIAGFALLILTASRIPNYSLRHEREATTFLEESIQVLEADSLIFSSADAETFALWYGAWVSGELLDRAPGSILVNVALYDQFEWYRRLIAHRHPSLFGLDGSTSLSLLQANRGERAIFFSEKIEPALPVQLEPAGPIWRYRMPQELK